MKNIFFVLFLLLFLASCSKESNLSDKDQDIQVSTRTQLTPEQVVAAFSPVVDGTYDPSKSYTGDEAIRGAETVMNYRYGDFRYKFDDTYSLEESFIVSKQNGVINDRVVDEIYDEALEFVKCHYADIVADTKMQLLTDLYIISETGSQIRVGLTNIVGTASSGIENMGTISFGQGDDWKADQGKCNDPNNSGNAPKQIARAATFNLVGQYAELGVWYSDIQLISYTDSDWNNWFAINPNDPNPGDFIIDYFMWQFDGCDELYDQNSNQYDACSSAEMPMRILQNGQPVENPDKTDAFCIDYPEMNYYLGNAQYMANKYVQSLNKKFLNIQMWFDYTPQIPYTYYYLWFGKGTYGKKNTDENRVPLTLGTCN